MTTHADHFEDMEDRIEALLGQKIIRGCRPVAAALAEAGEIVTFAPGEELMRQGGTDEDCHFILAGKVSITANGATFDYGRGKDDLVGELAAINTALVRTATLTAQTEVITLKCSPKALKAAGRAEPEVWRLLAIELSGKIEQRNQMIAVANTRPRIFVIAAESRIEIAEAIRLKLLGEADVDLWSEADLVPPGGYELDALHGLAKAADFGVVLAHPDDLRHARERLGEERWETVLFELGYLMAELTRHRTLILVPKGGEDAAPQLFKGVVPMTYLLPGDELPLNVAVAEVVDQIRKLVADTKCRSRLPGK